MTRDDDDDDDACNFQLTVPIQGVPMGYLYQAFDNGLQLRLQCSSSESCCSEQTLLDKHQGVYACRMALLAA